MKKSNKVSKTGTKISLYLSSDAYDLLSMTKLRVVDDIVTSKSDLASRAIVHCYGSLLKKG